MKFRHITQHPDIGRSGPYVDPATVDNCEFCPHEHPIDEMLLMGVTKDGRKRRVCTFDKCLKEAVKDLAQRLAIERHRRRTADAKRIAIESKVEEFLGEGRLAS